MTILHNERKHDLECREMIRTICIGRGLDIGCADRPIIPGIETLDYNPDYKPTYLADASKVPLPDETFDFVTALHILEHIDNTIDTLKEWKRVLKTGGKIGIVVPHGEGVDADDLGDSSLTHRTLFTEKTLKLFLEHVGFKDVNVQTIKRPLAYKENPAILAICQK